MRQRSRPRIFSTGIGKILQIITENRDFWSHVTGDRLIRRILERFLVNAFLVYKKKLGRPLKNVLATVSKNQANAVSIYGIAGIAGGGQK